MAETPLDPYTWGRDNLCFGCGPHNDRGMRLKFWREGDVVITRYVPERGMEGPPTIFHGGLQAALADEVAAWTLIGLRDRMGFTASMTLRLIRPIRVDQEIVGKGRIVSQTGHLYTIKVALEQAGKVGLTARVTYAVPDRASAERTIGRKLPESWKRYCLPEPGEGSSSNEG